MQEEQLSPEQSLQLIQAMINKTKQDLSADTIYFLVWGWITFTGCTGQFILKRLLHYDQHYQVWWLVIVGVVFSVWQGMKDNKAKKVSTYVDDSMKYLWIGMGVSFFVLSMIITPLGWGSSVFPFFIMLYGLGTFISGNFLRYRPLIAGGVMAWMLAIGAAYVPYDFQMLFAAAAILVSYIIPAYMLRSRNKSVNR